ncbi:MAG: GAF domain-containing protein [Myxococcota bacterium]|jgi:PAS domain S-box-containing protein|nr:GAF domain-containing protein [Myxococcota bacterium]
MLPRADIVPLGDWLPPLVWAVSALVGLLVLGGIASALLIGNLRRRKIEKELRLERSRLEGLLTLTQLAGTSERTLIEFALEEAVRLTSSEIGYVAFVAHAESLLAMYAWSREARARCRIPDPPALYPIDQTGLWGEPVRQRRPVIVNEYQQPSPLKKGLPAGHVALHRHLGVPFFDGPDLVGVVGVGDKQAPYDPGDVRQLELVMDGMWQILRRQRMEAQLRESEQTYRAIFEGTADGLLVHDLQTRQILDVNEGASSLLGVPREELLGARVEESLPPRPPHTPEELLRRLDLAALGEPQRFEWLASPPGRRARSLEVHVHRVIIGGASRMLAVLRDISERRRAELERQQLQDRLQHAQRLESLGVMAGGIAHDFNNLLTVIQGNAELVRPRLEGLPEGARLASFVDSIRVATQRAAQLTGQMLTYAGQGSFVFGPLDLATEIRELDPLLHAALPKKAELLVTLADDLPCIHGDAAQVRQVILNLVTNAAEALGDCPGTVRLSTRRQLADRTLLARAILGEGLPAGEYVALTVADTGAGMDQATTAKIFEPFFTTKFTGRGLGLAAVLGIVRQHGAAIAIASSPGEGSTFTVLFPSGRSDAAGAGWTPPATSPGSPEGVGRRRLLLVDDERAVREVTRAHLESAGYEVLTAGDGEEGTRLFAQHAASLDALLLDATMPKLSGREALAEIRKLHPAVPVLLISGHAARELASQFAGTGVKILQKPFQRDELLASLAELLDPPRAVPPVDDRDPQQRSGAR